MSFPISVHWLSVYSIWPLLCCGMFLLSLFRALIMKGLLKCVKGHFQSSGDDCVISIRVIILIQLTNLCMFESTFHPQEENNLFIVYDHLIVLLKAFYWKNFASVLYMRNSLQFSFFYCALVWFWFQGNSGFSSELYSVLSFSFTWGSLRHIWVSSSNVWYNSSVNLSEAWIFC